MKIGQIVHHTLLFPQTIATLAIPRLRVLLQRSKIWLGCKYWMSSLCDRECCMGQASKIIFREK